MPELIDLTGRRFSKLSVIGVSHRAKGRKTIWNCVCDCGAEYKAEGNHLRGGRTRSCKACVIRPPPKNKTHGLAGTRVYKAWINMIHRCNDPTFPQFMDYGGRGIRICERWMRFENFLDDMGIPPDGKTLERNKTSGNYTPENCRWATRTEQQRNTRRNRMLTCDGQTMCVSEWAEKLGVNPGSLYSRIKIGWSDERTIKDPKFTRRKTGMDERIKC